MSPCKGCTDAHDKITHLEGRVETLEIFKKWAEPIISDIKSIKTDNKWMIAIAILFSALVTYVYHYQVYPFFEKQQDANTKIIKMVADFKIETLNDRAIFKNKVFEMLQDNEKKINNHSTNMSKKSVKSLRSTLYNQRDDIKEAISQKPNINVNQRVGD